jgi:hypothetical protein
MTTADSGRAAAVRFEPLETRLLLAVSGEEQLFVYLLNRARHNPAAYQQEAQLQTNLAGVAAQPPLAINNNLFDSAEFHVTEMANYNYYAYVSPITGDWPNQLAREAGYPLPSAYPDAWNNIESIDAGAPRPEDVLRRFIEDGGVNPPLHRIHLLAIDPFYQNHREIGVGHAANPSSDWIDYWSVQTAYREGGPTTFLTGVVFQDLDLDGRYDLNEGLGGAIVSTETASVLTNPYGGYSIPVAPGRQTMAVQGASFNGTSVAVVNVGTQNVEVDFISGVVAGIINFGAGTSAPSPPTGVNASDGTSTQLVHVTWNASAGATSYEVWRYTANDNLAAEKIATVTSGTAYDDTGAAPATRYYYWVKAANPAATSGFSASDQGRRNSPPTVASLTPSPDSLFPGAKLTLTAGGAADADGTIARVQFYRDVNGSGIFEPGTDTALGYGTLSAGAWSWTGSTGALPYATVGFFARAQDNNNAWSPAAAATITVNNPDPEPPTAALTAGDLEASPSTPFTFTVIYQDNVAVDRSDIGASDLRVTGPNGFNKLAAFVRADRTGDASPITVTYSVPTPVGGWGYIHNGTYTVSMEPKQVGDTNNNFVAAGDLGTFDVNLPDSPDLTATLRAVTLPTPLVPGDRGSISVVLKNIGGRPAKGTIVNRAILADDGGVLPDLLLASQSLAVALNPGQTRTLAFYFTVPAGMPEAPAYRLRTDVNATAAIVENRTDNNSVGPAGTWPCVWHFGNVGLRRNVAALIPDADGTIVTFSMVGAGTGRASQHGSALDVQISGSTTATSVTLTARRSATPGDDGLAALCDVNIGDPLDPADFTMLGTFAARASTLSGNVIVTGGVGTLVLDDLPGSHTIRLAYRPGPAFTTAITLDQVDGLGLFSAVPIRTFTATAWTGYGDFTAPSVGTFAVRGDPYVRHIQGDCRANLTLTDAAAKQSLGTMTVAGWYTGKTDAASSIGSVTVGGLLDADIYAGVKDLLTGLRDPETDFDADAVIQRLTVSGIKAAPASMINSNVAARTLGTMRLGTIQFVNDLPGVGLTPFGLAARTLTRLTYKTGTTANYTWPNANPAEKAGPLPVQQFVVRLAPVA